VFPTPRALPEVVAAVKGKVEVLMEAGSAAAAIS
jgi:isopentenyl diphosphate isomerase/L-lactate dehydrogenase-like FMN-dependent dehydrogenase